MDYIIVNEFSVLISVYISDNPNHFRRCMESIAHQTLTPSEIILVCDGPVSSDVEMVIQDYINEINLVIIRLVENIGLAGALNYGLSYCSHELIIRMDSDDICIPTRFDKQIRFMTENSNVVASSSWVQEFCDSAGNISVRKVPVDPKDVIKFSKIRSPLNHPAVIFRKSIIQQVGGYPNLRKSQDYALWSLLLIKGFTISNIDEVLVKMRTGDQLFERRGLNYLKEEFKLLKYQLSIGFLSPPEFTRSLIIRTVMRLAPQWLKRRLYRLVRE